MQGIQPRFPASAHPGNLLESVDPGTEDQAGKRATDCNSSSVEAILASDRGPKRCPEGFQ